MSFHRPPRRMAQGTYQVLNKFYAEHDQINRDGLPYERVKSAMPTRDPDPLTPSKYRGKPVRLSVDALNAYEELLDRKTG